MLAETVCRLRSTFDSGKTRPLSYRLEQLRGIKAFLQNHEKEIEEALMLDLARPSLEVYMGDLALTLSEVELTLKQLKKWSKPERVPAVMSVRPGKTYIYREPVGLVLIISPWNYPIQLCLVPLIGAIAAGNTVIVKPSELAPATSSVIARLLPRYVDEDVIQIIEGGVNETTELLNQKFDHIFYTGNGRVARIIMEAAAKHLTPVTLELGGKSPCMINEDVDVQAIAKRIIWGKFSNAGQTCIAPDYILVHKKIEAAMLAVMKKCLIDFYGPDPELSKDFGRIINAQHYARLIKLIESGGEIVVGGVKEESKRYIAPTILTKVNIDSPLMTDEIFGPILPVLAVNNMDEAIAFVNARAKPLALYLFTDDKTVQEKVIAETSSGGVVVNHTLMHVAVPALPFGGIGESGMGAYHGKQTFETFSHRKAVLMKPSWFDLPIMYPPYSDRKKKWLRWLI